MSYVPRIVPVFRESWMGKESDRTIPCIAARSCERYVAERSVARARARALSRSRPTRMIKLCHVWRFLSYGRERVTNSLLIDQFHLFFTKIALQIFPLSVVNKRERKTWIKIEREASKIDRKHATTKGLYSTNAYIISRMNIISRIFKRERGIYTVYNNSMSYETKQFDHACTRDEIRMVN